MMIPVLSGHLMHKKPSLWGRSLGCEDKSVSSLVRLLILIAIADQTFSSNKILMGTHVPTVISLTLNTTKLTFFGHSAFRITSALVSQRKIYGKSRFVLIGGLNHVNAYWNQ
jgi:hypothetical protein